MQPTPVILPGESHERRILVGCSLWGRQESGTTERLHFHFSLSCIGEGNGNPLQYSCLENPRDRGACWAAIYGGRTESDTTDMTQREQQQQRLDYIAVKFPLITAFTASHWFWEIFFFFFPHWSLGIFENFLLDFFSVLLGVQQNLIYPQIFVFSTFFFNFS